MQLIDARTSTLVLVDYQTRLLPAIDQGERCLRRAIWLAHIARSLGIPVFGTEQNPDGLGQNDAALREMCDRTLVKQRFDGCVDGLLGYLNESGATYPNVVIGGCEAHVCLMQTAAGLLEAGYRVFLASDICGSRAPDDRALALQRLHAAGAVLVSVEMVAFEWLRSHRHPEFRTLLPLLRTGPDGAATTPVN